MRLLIAMMKHETNTFSPVVTDLARFSRAGGKAPDGGAAAVAAYRGTGTVTGAYIDIAEARAPSSTWPIAADAWPSGPVEDAAYEAISGADPRRGTARRLRRHPARLARRDGHAQPRGRRRRHCCRASAPSTPEDTDRGQLDMHANVYPEMVLPANVVAGYQTYPHVDMYDTGRRAGTALMRMLKGEVRPDHRLGQRTDAAARDAPGHGRRTRTVRCRRAARPWRLRVRRAPACSSASRMRTSATPGLSVVITTDNDTALAERLRDELLDRGLGAARSLRLPARAAGAVGGARQGHDRRSGLPARPLRQRRLRRADGHHRACWPRSCASGWTTSPSSASSIRRPCARPSPPASARRSRCRSAASRRCRCAPSPANPFRSAAASRRSSTASTAPRARWRPARSRIWGMRWCWTPAAWRSCCSRAMSSPST